MPTQEDFWRNNYQYRMEDYVTAGPEGDTAAVSYIPRYLTDMLGLRDLVQRGKATPWEQQLFAMQAETARSVPARDVSTLRAGYGEGEGYLGGDSPDLGHVMLNLLDKIERGQASPQERQLFDETYRLMADQTYRSVVPQASDSPIGLGDNLFGALSILGLGAGAGAALAPLAAGAGLTLSSAAGLAGTAGTMTGMAGQALDNEALKKAGLATGLAGGVGGLASLLSKGVSSVGDLVGIAQKTWGTAQKGMSLASSFGKDAPSSSSSGSGGGGGMDFSQLGTILSGVVGAVGSKLSLEDASRYMEQLKSQFGDQQQVKDLIDQAYTLAAARYETFYAQTQQEQEQKQTAYKDALSKYQTHYQQTQQEQEQRQAAYQKGEGQLDQDRATQYEHYRDQRAKYDQSYQQKVQEAAQDRERKINVFGEDRQLAMADYNRRVQEAQQDRQKEYSTFDQQFARHLSTADKRDFEAAQERGLDLNAYMQRQAIGADLRDPAKIKAGAEALYNPLSELARGNISEQVQAEMASRGVVDGQAANYMSAKAFAPSEQALWQNALQAYMSGQTGALNAYSQQDMTTTPQYQWANTPNFTNSPEYRYATVPDFGGTPEYRGTNVPQFSRTGQGNVPGAVGQPTSPGVPTTVRPGDSPRPDTWSPNPYQPYNGQNKGVSDLVSNLTKALTGSGGAAGGIFGLIKSIFGGGSGLTPEQTASITNELQNSMNTNNDLWGFGDGNYDYASMPTWGGSESDYLPADTSNWDWDSDW